MANTPDSTPRGGPPERSFRLGDFLIEPSLSRISGEGQTLQVEPKVMQVLVHLAHQQGKLVTKDELLSAGWSGRVVVEGVLKRVISVLRRTFRDDARSPRFIETIPKKGYRLLAPVEWLAPASTIGRVTSYENDLVAAPKTPTVAVLPLANPGRDPSQEYFADGMTELLITQLAKLSGLRVISRTSIMRFKQSDRSLPSIARVLGADAIVEGAVWREGGRVRVTAQLIDPQTDHHRWAESYERDVESVLELQSELTQAIAAEIHLTLSADEQRRLRAPTVVPAAYDAYLRGVHFWNTRSADGFEKAMRCFREAISCDESYTPAYVGLADTCSIRGLYGELPPIDAFEQARVYAERALERDPQLGAAHASIGAIRLFHDWDFETAERDFRKALELGPSETRARLAYADLLSACARHEEAIAQIREALRLTPLDPGMNMNAGDFFTFARRYEEAFACYARALELDDGMLRAYVRLARCYAYDGQFEAARGTLQEARRRAPSSSLVTAASAIGHGLAGDRRAARRELEVLHAALEGSHLLPYAMAEAHAATGAAAEALRNLDEALEVRATGLIFLAVDPVFDRIRSEPAFARRVKQVARSGNPA